jgi:uncharacterized membrane protein
MAIKGYWLVLPFAGLELLALGAAFHLTACRLRTREVILIDGDKLRVEQGRMRRTTRGLLGRPERSNEFPRGWVRVDLERRHEWYPSRLTISASGRRVVVGSFLPEKERKQLAQELRRMLAWRRFAGQPA